ENPEKESQLLRRKRKEEFSQSNIENGGILLKNEFESNIISVKNKFNYKGNTISLLTYNIKNPKLDNDNWILRLEKIISEIKNYNSDIICLQEISEDILIKFTSNFDQYTFYYCENDCSNMLNVTLYKTSLFTLIRVKTLDLKHINDIKNYNRGVHNLT